MSLNESVDAELELLERVLFRLGFANTDEQLETTVNKFLSPVLLKITSSNENVRKKVMEILTHINKRLKSRPSVQINLEPLLAQYKESNSTFLINFAIIYITMGFPRQDIQQQTEMAPILLNCLEGKPETHQDKLLMLVLPLLGSIKIPENPEKREALLGLSNKPNTKQQLLAVLMDILLLPYGVTAVAVVPPGMSNYSFKRATQDNLKAEELEQLKKGIVRFLSAGVFLDEDILPHLIIASADTRFSVATPAIAELSKISSSLDWSDPKLTSTLYVLFSGNGSKIPDRKTSGGSARVRQKILQNLLKCTGKGIITSQGIQVIFEGLFGENTNQKCKVLALKFAYNLISFGPKDLINKLSKVLLTGLSKVIGTTSTESYDVQNAAYSAISQLALVCPSAVNANVNLVVTYFNHLEEAPTELQDSIREALVALAQSFSWKIPQNTSSEGVAAPDNAKFVPNSNQLLLLGLLTEKAESKTTIVHNAASIYLTTCFPDFYVPSRYLLIVICGQNSTLKENLTTFLYGVPKKDNVNYSNIVSVDCIDEETLRLSSKEKEGTNFLSAVEQKKIILPSFISLIRHVNDLATKKQTNPNERVIYGKFHLAYDVNTYVEILDYLRLCLWYSAGVQTYPGDDKKINVIGKYIRKLNDDGLLAEVEMYNTLISALVSARKGFTELSCLSDLLSSTPEIIAEKNIQLLPVLSASLKEISETNRSLIAKVFGILLAYSTTDAEFDTQIKDLYSMTQRSLEYQHGCVLAISNAFYRKISIMKTSATFAVESLNNWQQYKDTVTLLVSLLKSPQALLQSAAIKGLSLIGSIAPLPMPNALEENAEPKKKDSVDAISKNSVSKILFDLLESSHTRQKIREDSILCLGYLAIGDGKYFVKKVLDGFFGLIKMTKDPALHIAMGQALVYAIQGTSDINDDLGESKAVGSKTLAQRCSDADLDTLLTSIINIVPEPHGYARQAAAIWLLALVKNCADRDPILDKKQTLQMAFTELLSEDSELVQDVASRGLGIIFSLSNTDVQSELSNALLEQLTGGRRQVNKVAGDTKLFEEGVLGKAPTGGNLTTYKELCSLASDLNQPDMIYQFMQLANHNATWNSKLGAAFGLQSISKVAKLKMEPYLGKIVPRLFRYKYDPTPKIQNSMVSIWDSVVTDSKSTIELYYWEILDDVTTNLTSTLWRTRIACCLAARDLIRQSSGLKLRSDAVLKNSTNKPPPGTSSMDVDEVPEPELARLWSQLFRVMDDIHDGTRLAAQATATILSKVCVTASSSDHGKSGLNVSSSILPLLLDTGVTHTVSEIRKLSIQTVSDLIESAGSLIMPHLDKLVPCLLRATGDLDSAKLSYLSTMLGSQTGTQEVIDSMRAESAKQHYTMETLSKCIRFIDYASFEKMTPAVLDLMKSTVQMGTKVACAHFICLISVQIGNEMQPLVSKYLGACFIGLSDRNATVRKYYASAIGHLIGYAKEQSIINLFNKLSESYFELQSVRSKAVPLTIQAINKRHQEALKDYSSHILPLMFFAMHEEVNEDNKSTIELWQELWNDISTGDSGLKMNLDSIMLTLETSLNNPSWTLKAQSGNAINTLATRLATSLSDSDRIKLVDMLLNNIGGRTFLGKERLLQALASLCKNLVKDERNYHIRIIEAAMKECRKEEPLYRTAALKATGDILAELKEDRFEEVYNMVWYLLDKQDMSSLDGDEPSTSSGSSSTGNTSDDRNKQMMIFINLKQTVCETLGKAWPINSYETQVKYQVMFVEKCVECLNLNTRPVQLSLLLSLGRFLERLQILNDDSENMQTDADDDEENQLNKKKFKGDDGNNEEVLAKICQHVLRAVVNVAGIPHTGLKKEALNVLVILIKKLKTKQNKIELDNVKKVYEQISVILQKDTAPEVKCRLKEIEDKLAEK